MKRIFSIALLSVVAALSYAQTFYEVTFKDPDTKEKYIGLFIYNDDEDCKVRFVTDKMLSEDMVAECNYTSQTADKESRNDVGVMAFAPDKDNYPIFLWIWEKSDASDINEKPYITYDINDENSYFEAESFDEITLADMTKEYVSQFFSESEPEYALLLSGIETVRNNNNGYLFGGPVSGNIASTGGGSASGNILPSGHSATVTTPTSTTPTSTITSPAPTTQHAASTFHLIMVANTEVSDIGAACSRDLSNIRSEFSAISKVLGLKYNETLVSGDRFSKQAITNALNRLSPGSNDIVMFVYTGHGFRFDDQRDYYPNMDLRETSYDDPQVCYMPMSEIYDIISRKGARLNIVLSDCCNAFIGVESPMTNSNFLFSRSNSNFDINKMRTLFLGTSGNVWATAASPGEVSWCNVSGGFFLVSFLENLRKQISPLERTAPTWQALINNAIASAKKKSTSNSSTKAQNGMQQVNTKPVKI